MTPRTRETGRLWILGWVVIATTQIAAPLASAEQPAEAPRSVDISVSGIFLDDASSAASVLGPVPPVPTEKPGRDFPTLEVCNSSKTEVLVLVFHYGDQPNRYSEFRVSRARKSPRCFVPAGGIKQFVTGKGIRLGMSSADLVHVLGTPSSRRMDGRKTTLKYALEAAQEPSFFNRYDRPTYSASYRLWNDTLVGFEFGFPAR